MIEAKPVRIYIVDDDTLLLDAVASLLEASGYFTEKYASGTDFLAQLRPDDFGCLLVDIKMPNVDGLELMHRLSQIHTPFAVLVMSGYADVELAVEAVKAGAIDILQKPFSREQLLLKVGKAEAIALELSKSVQGEIGPDDPSKGLSAREHQILNQVMAGLSAKEAARELGLSPRTVEFHRANVMKKLGARRLLDLVRKSRMNSSKSN